MDGNDTIQSAATEDTVVESVATAENAQATASNAGSGKGKRTYTDAQVQGFYALFLKDQSTLVKETEDIEIVLDVLGDDGKPVMETVELEGETIQVQKKQTIAGEAKILRIPHTAADAAAKLGIEDIPKNGDKPAVSAASIAARILKSFETQWEKQYAEHLKDNQEFHMRFLDGRIGGGRSSLASKIMEENEVKVPELW